MAPIRYYFFVLISNVFNRLPIVLLVLHCYALAYISHTPQNYDVSTILVSKCHYVYINIYYIHIAFSSFSSFDGRHVVEQRDEMIPLLVLFTVGKTLVDHTPHNPCGVSSDICYQDSWKPVDLSSSIKTMSVLSFLWSPSQHQIVHSWYGPLDFYRRPIQTKKFVWPR